MMRARMSSVCRVKVNPESGPIEKYPAEFSRHLHEQFTGMAHDPPHHVEQHETQSLRTGGRELFGQRQPLQRRERIVENRVRAEPSGLGANPLAPDPTARQFVHHHVMNMLDRPGLQTAPLDDLQSVALSIRHRREALLTRPENLLVLVLGVKRFEEVTDRLRGGKFMSDEFNERPIGPEASGSAPSVAPAALPTCRSPRIVRLPRSRGRRRTRASQTE